jgi:hypothetical protein
MGAWRRQAIRCGNTVEDEHGNLHEPRLSIGFKQRAKGGAI